MIQIGRSIPLRCLISAIMRSTSRTCSGSSTFGIKIRSGLSPTIQPNPRAQGNWLMRTMRSHDPNRRPQGISHQNAGGIFFAAMHGIFQVENDGVGRMQGGVDVVLRLRAGQIEARAPQPVFGRGRRQRSCSGSERFPASFQRAGRGSMRAESMKGSAPSS